MKRILIIIAVALGIGGCAAVPNDTTEITQAWNGANTSAAKADAFAQAAKENIDSGYIFIDGQHAEVLKQIFVAVSTQIGNARGAIWDVGQALEREQKATTAYKDGQKKLRIDYEACKYVGWRTKTIAKIAAWMTVLLSLVSLIAPMFSGGLGWAMLAKNILKYSVFLPFGIVSAWVNRAAAKTPTKKKKT